MPLYVIVNNVGPPVVKLFQRNFARGRCVCTRVVGRTVPDVETGGQCSATGHEQT